MLNRFTFKIILKGFANYIENDNGIRHFHWINNCYVVNSHESNHEFIKLWVKCKQIDWYYREMKWNETMETVKMKEAARTQ